ncbi:hypothetical protein GGR50DRAFT_272255 [Xylaria sp. CBS 124048]|nr:hypothetical protein GGR50DRAFT_272255 [Xylaria sp. CBS 124048]
MRNRPSISTRTLWIWSLGFFIPESSSGEMDSYNRDRLRGPDLALGRMEGALIYTRIPTHTHTHSRKPSTSLLLLVPVRHLLWSKSPRELRSAQYAPRPPDHHKAQRSQGLKGSRAQGLKGC